MATRNGYQLRVQVPSSGNTEMSVTLYTRQEILQNPGEPAAVAAVKYLCCVKEARLPKNFCEMNLLSPGRYGSKFQSMIFKVIIQNSS